MFLFFCRKIFILSLYHIAQYSLSAINADTVTLVLAYSNKNWKLYNEAGVNVYGRDKINTGIDNTRLIKIAAVELFRSMSEDKGG